MCGIAGFVKFRGSLQPAEVVARMLHWLAHRGPDEEGIWSNSLFAIGTARLAIIDLVSGRQPIANEDKTVWTSFNGEIYNFLELRSQLERLGHHFRTRTDTEVIVHAYEQWRERFVEHLKGMFSIAVLDLQRHHLYLARDLAGEKPLFFTSQPEFFAFASEIKPLLHELPIAREIEPLAVDSFFAFSRPVGSLCVFRSIQKLKPGQLLRLNVLTGEYTISTYWKPPKAKLCLTENEAEELLMRLLEDTIQRFLIADVPIGAFLSGGTDSSAVVAMMRRFFEQPVKTFTAIYDDPFISEANEARLVAKSLSTDHHEVLIRPPEVLQVLPKLIWHLEEPFADASFIPAYFVSREARQFVKVALTGDGGDELFGGYDWYLAWRVLEQYRKLPRMLRSFGQWIIERIPLQYLVGYPSFYHYVMGAKRVVNAATEQGDIASFLALTSDGNLPSLLPREAREELIILLKDRINGYEGEDSLDRIMFFQFRGLLPELFFTKLDRMSMANSLECRSPLVYKDIVEFAISLPMKLKLKGVTRKYLLKRAFERFLPKEILYRPKKGFSIPFYRWLREDPTFRKLVERYALCRCAEFLPYASRVNYQFVVRVAQDYLTGKHNRWVLPWKAVCFGIWWETFVLRDGRKLVDPLVI
ncbi:MAG: asparagine synthase (glutamine-hydrolyzing) [Candidatus Methanomethylicaceae archaeon]